MKKVGSIGAALALTIGLVGCGDDTKVADETTTTAASSTTTAEGGVTVEGAWARTSPMMASAGAAYFVIKGGTEDDELTGVSIDKSVAGTAQIHETVMSDDSMSSTTMGKMSGESGMSGTEMSGAMEMRPVASIQIPAGEAIEFKPGGYHVMLLELVKPLKVGDKFVLQLSFAKAGTVDVDVEVKDAP